MVAYFFDASSLVKRYKTEPGTAEVNSLIDSASLVDRAWISMLTWVELTSAMIGAVRGGHLSMVTGAYILNQFEVEFLSTPEVWPVTSEILIAAVSLLKEHPLRTGDAIQLASLLDVRNNLADPDITFVVSDRRLAQAAVNAGVVNVITPGLLAS